MIGVWKLTKRYFPCRYNESSNRDIYQEDIYELPTPESWLDHGVQVPSFANRIQHSIHESWCLLEAKLFVHILHP